MTTSSDRLGGHLLAFEEAAGFGGAFVDLKHICLDLRRRGMRVSIARTYDDPCWTPLAEAGCTLLWHPRFDLAQRLNRSGIVPRRVRMGVYGLEQASVNFPSGLYYGAWARKHGVTALFCNNSFTRNTASIVASKLAGVPLYSYHQGVQDGTGAYSKLLPFVDYIFTVSNYVRDIELQFGPDPAIVETLYPGVDPSPEPGLAQPRPDDGRVRVGMVGVFTEWKGHLAFLDAFARVAAEAPNADAWLFGKALPGEPQTVAAIKARIASMGLGERVRLVEGRTRPEEIYPNIDFNVHTSLLPEPFGRVVIEPMAYRRPVVAADSGGPVEVIRPGETGYLADPKNPADLSEKILRFVRDRDHRLACGERAYQDVQERFSYPAVIEPLIRRIALDNRRRGITAPTV
jgi:hypothetical protein